jgi:hemerythrin-like metal-binding protein
MSVISWNDDYNVNVEIIDTQHRKLLELVRNLHSAVEARIDKESLKQLLVDLVEFTDTHFATEEQYMKEYEFPGYDVHCKEHEMLLGHMHDLVERVSSGKYPTFYSDYDVSNDWALVHIAQFDKGLGQFLNSKGVY